MKFSQSKHGVPQAVLAIDPVDHTCHHKCTLSSLFDVCPCRGTCRRPAAGLSAQAWQNCRSIALDAQITGAVDVQAPSLSLGVVTSQALSGCRDFQDDIQARADAARFKFSTSSSGSQPPAGSQAQLPAVSSATTGYRSSTPTTPSPMSSRPAITPSTSNGKVASAPVSRPELEVRPHKQTQSAQ